MNTDIYLTLVYHMKPPTALNRISRRRDISEYGSLHLSCKMTYSSCISTHSQYALMNDLSLSENVSS